MLRSRTVFLAVFLVCAALIGYGYYLQYGQGLEPCPLCLLQRVCYIAVGMLSLLAAVHHPRSAGIRAYAALASLAAIAGILFAGRQVWLQHLPPEKVPACGPGLDYWMQTMPLAEAVKKAFRGSGECAEIDWTFLGLSIAEWSLFWFVVLLIALAVPLFRGRRHQRDDFPLRPR